MNQSTRLYSGFAHLCGLYIHFIPNISSIIIILTFPTHECYHVLTVTALLCLCAGRVMCRCICTIFIMPECVGLYMHMCVVWLGPALLGTY